MMALVDSGLVRGKVAPADPPGLGRGFQARGSEVGVGWETLGRGGAGGGGGAAGESGAGGFRAALRQPALRWGKGGWGGGGLSRPAWSGRALPGSGLLLIHRAGRGSDDVSRRVDPRGGEAGVRLRPPGPGKGKRRAPAAACGWLPWGRAVAASFGRRYCETGDWAESGRNKAEKCDGVQTAWRLSI
ncbi:CCHC-type zinc finger nucleic acid binding protein isoform X1 [Phalacrocorax carbo]|uniref:CCHC-type zinc finger nucleic acid binding protein isoform X1 n=1 Tax=Phalacrocorax carbo TaxID=9209 RepID=UPI0031199232